MSITIDFWIVNEMIFNGREQQSAQWARSFARLITQRFICITEYWIELMMVWVKSARQSGASYTPIHESSIARQWEAMLDFTYDILMVQCSNVTKKTKQFTAISSTSSTFIHFLPLFLFGVEMQLFQLFVEKGDSIADLNFFSSFLPDIRFMSASQKRHFKIPIFQHIDNV